MGPIETKLRYALGHGIGVGFVDVHNFGGSMARGILNRLIREGAAVQREGNRYTLADYSPDPAMLAAGNAARLERIQARQRAQAEVEDRARRYQEEQRARAEREAQQRQQEIEQRNLYAGLRAYAQDERQLVLAERIAALRESRAA